MQITEHAGQAQPTPRLPGMDPSTAARAPLDSKAERSAARPSENVGQDRADRPAAARSPRKPVRYGAGF